MLLARRLRSFGNRKVASQSQPGESTSPRAECGEPALDGRLGADSARVDAAEVAPDNCGAGPVLLRHAMADYGRSTMFSQTNAALCRARLLVVAGSVAAIVISIAAAQQPATPQPATPQPATPAPTVTPAAAPAPAV